MLIIKILLSLLLFSVFICCANTQQKNSKKPVEDDFTVPLQYIFIFTVVDGIEVGKDYLMKVKLADKNDTVTVISFANNPFMASEKSRNKELHPVKYTLNKGYSGLFHVYWIGPPKSKALKTYIQNKPMLYGLIDGKGRIQMRYYNVYELLGELPIMFNCQLL